MELTAHASLPSTKNVGKLVFLATLLALPRAHADTLPADPRHALGAGVGLRADVVREDLVVPLGFAGPGLRLLPSYRGRVGPGVLAARADLGLAFLFNRYGHIAATLDYGAEAAWTVTVRRRENWHLALGPALALDSRVNYIYSWDDAHVYWLGSEWLGPAARYGRHLNDRWRLEAGATLALLGFEGRPPTNRYNKQEASPHLGYFFTQPHRSERFVFINDLQVIRLDLAARRAAYSGSDVGRGWSFGLDFRLARTGIPATNINLGVCFYASRAWGLF
jgi:hypothetical protein